MQDAIEDKQIELLVNKCDNLLTVHMPAMFECLSHNHSKVRSKEVTQKDNEVMAMTWQPTDPIVLLSRPIEQL